MTSISEAVEQLDRVLGVIRAVEAHLHEAEHSWLEGAEQLIHVLVGSEMPEVGELARLDDLVRQQFDQVRAALAAAAGGVLAYRARLAGSAHSGPSAAPVAAGVRARDGSRYPAASAWCADTLPRRVVEGRPDEKTVGYVHESFTRYVSGIDDSWTPAIVRRMRLLRIASARLQGILKSHVELKVATMMIEQGRKRCELTINHVPCGSQPRQLPGCHEVLERYLPKGYTLVVNGTTQQGEPYSHRYEGQA